MTYVFPLISTTFFLFLADFPSLVFFLFLYKHVTLGSYDRTTIHKDCSKSYFLRLSTLSMRNVELQCTCGFQFNFMRTIELM